MDMWISPARHGFMRLADFAQWRGGFFWGPGWGGTARSGLFLFFPVGQAYIPMACNGMLAGLVAITAPCAFVSPTAATVIGILAGLLVCAGVLFNERTLKIDDPCGAISVHGYCGWLGA